MTARESQRIDAPRAHRLPVPATLATLCTLLDFAPSTIWFTSIGIPTGTELVISGPDEDPETGETYTVEPWDGMASAPFDFAGVSGTVSQDGETWSWEGEGDPTDWNQNTVLAIKGFRD